MLCAAWAQHPVKLKLRKLHRCIPAAQAGRGDVLAGSKQGVWDWRPGSVTPGGGAEHFLKAVCSFRPMALQAHQRPYLRPSEGHPVLGLRLIKVKSSTMLVLAQARPHTQHHLRTEVDPGQCRNACTPTRRLHGKQPHLHALRIRLHLFRSGRRPLQPWCCLPAALVKVISYSYTTTGCPGGTSC